MLTEEAVLEPRQPDVRNDAALADHAGAFERMLPEIARRLFTMPHSGLLEDLPSAQLKVVNLLLDGRRTISQIGEEMRISASAATQVADRLEKAGVVERVSDNLGEGGDRRHRYLQLTERGETLMRARREYRRSRITEMLKHIPAARHAELRAAFETILAACREV